MIKNPILFIIDNNGDYLRYGGMLRAINGYREFAFVISTRPLTDSVSMSIMTNNANYNRFEQYVLPTAIKVNELIEESDALYQTIADWNVFGVEIKPTALADISNFRSGATTFSFQFQTPHPSVKCVTYKGVFGVDNPLPTTGRVTGDYYECEDWNFYLTSGTQTYTFTKGMYVYFNGSRWIKDALLVELNTSTVSIPVEPSHAVGYEIDDDDANYLASIGAAAILAQQTAEQSAQDVEDLRSGDLAFKVVAYDTTYSGEIAIGQTKWNGTFKCLETRVSDNVVIQHGQENLQYVRSVSSIQNGQAVYFVGSTGQRMEVSVAGNASQNQARGTIAIATENFTPSGELQWGFVCTYGLVNGIKTDYAGWATGDTLWLSANGALTNSRPNGMAYRVRVGVVGRVHGTDGSLFVAPQYYATMGDLSQVDTSNPQTGDIYVRQANGSFINSQRLVELEAHLEDVDSKDADTLQEAKEYADEKDAYKLDKIWTDLTNQTTSFLTDEFVLNRGNSVYKTTLATMLSNVVATEIFVVVQELPEIGQINKIYLVISQESETQNIYDEFIWAFNEDTEEYGWERIGSASVDLSNYFNKTEINSMLGNKVDKVTGTSPTSQVYGKDVSGNQVMYNLAIGLNIAGAVVLRDAEGRSSILTPTTDNHITNKKYVDDADTLLSNRIDDLDDAIGNIDTILNSILGV